MAEIRCPNCGKDNPAALTFCQYCQALLSPETSMHIGDKPTKKNTGELEPVLPDWLRDVRQQARDLAEQDAAETASMPKVQKEEPPDLLAGLVSQSSSDEEEIPDWLAGLGSSKAEQKPAAPARSISDFFAQTDQPAPAPTSEPEPAPPERDELSEWFAKASEEPAKPFELDSDSSGQAVDWNFEAVSPLSSQAPAPEPEAEEDLSWLRDLEAESRKTGELSRPGKEEDGSFGFGETPQAASSGQDDLSWLDQLGALPASEQPPQPSAGAGDDLSWLEDLGALPAQDVPAQETRPDEDLGWLQAFAATPTSSQQEPAKDEMSWLDSLGGTSHAPSAGPDQPASADDLSWLRDLEGSTGTFSSGLDDSSGEAKQPETPATPGLPHISPFVPRKTAPLQEGAEPEIPDWLKSATEEPSMPLGPQALDRMREDRKGPGGREEAVSKALLGAAFLKPEGSPAEPEPATPEPLPASPSGESAALFSEVSPLFSDDLPDWLSSTEPASDQAAEEIGIHAEGGEALSPAELPSWVQAMRPVEAMIATAGPDLSDQPMERVGPLAGLKGVIPMAAIGALRRPQPIPLTLQASEDQQASAALLEQILLRETTPRPLVSTPVMISQRRLRWLVSGLLLFVLIAVIFSGTQIMPVSPLLPPAAVDVSSVVRNVADNAPVLVILDYEPALAGEMEAVSGPVLDQLVQLHNPYLSFISTSPSGNALVERLLSRTMISQPGGAGYLAGQNYTNMGFLPGGESGVLAFLQSPQTAIPASPVLEFSEYAAIFLLSDHAESARTWVEQISAMKQVDPLLASQPLVAVSSAQTGPMLEPYVRSGQITGMVSGLPTAARYELLNNNRPGTARSYWDAFGVGMMMAVFLIVIGSLWSLYTGIRARRAETAEE